MATPGSTPGGKLYVGWSNNRTNTIDGNGGSFDSSFPSQSLQQHGQPSSHEQAQYLGHQHSQNPPTYTPFLLIPKRNGDQQQQQQQPQQHHYHDPQRGNNGFLQEADPGGDERGASMVLSNPVPDYSVAAASSPFTLQAQAPHFQPRPRPLSQAYPRHPGQDLSQDPRQNYNLEWEYQQHQQQQQQQQQQQHYQQRQPYQHHDQYHDQQQQQHRQQQQQQQRRPQHHEQQSYRSGEGSDPRLSDLLPVPTEIGLLLSDHPSTSTSGSRDELQYQQQQHQQQPRHLAPYTNGGPSKGSDEDEYGDDSGRGGEFDASGKKVRKRRRLKGELPRDYALRKYKCTECEQKFARPSALATHVLTHTKEKPFICGTCDRGFAVMSNLRRHCRVRKHDTTATQTDANLSSPPGALGPDASRWG